jgi:hypothetical protein
MSKTAIGLVALAMLTCLASTGLAGTDDISIPLMLNYQGKLADSSGSVVRDSVYSVTFSLYPSASGGSPLWSETQPIQTRGGLFACLLGAVTPLAQVPADGYCFLEMQVNPNPALVPRVRIVSAAYAFLARHADTADFAPGGTNFWTNSGSGYVYPNTPGSGNTGIRAYGSGSTSYNLFVQTNARGQFGLYGNSDQDSSFGVGGYNSQYQVLGMLGYGFYRNLVPKVYPCGVYGSGGAARDGIYGITSAPACFGVWGHNSATTGTGIAGSGNDQTASLPADGAGGAFTGYKYGSYARATDLNSGDQTAGGYFQADANTTTNRCWAACWSASGNGYRMIGNGACASGFMTRDGERAMISVESPEALAEDVGRARLANGHCRVELDPLFSDCITVSPTQPLEVFVQLLDDCQGVYVKCDARGFDVRELQGGKSSAEFSYRVLAHRKGMTLARFPDAPHAMEVITGQR